VFAWVIAASIRHRLLVLLATFALVGLGLQAFQGLPIDAVPDLTNVQVQVLTSAPEMGPIDVERMVTAPVELAMTGLPRLRELRSISRYGTSAVTVVFEDGVSSSASGWFALANKSRRNMACPSSDP